MIRCKMLLGIILFEAALVCIFYTTACLSVKHRQPDLQALQQLATSLMLTDLAFWTEATYTRHPSQIDFFTPFQDLPGAMEHFPAGSLVPPPPAWGVAPPANNIRDAAGE